MYKNPIPTVDIIIYKDGGIVLIRRDNKPFGWAIPGGFIDYGECTEDAAIREAKEETNLDVKDLKLFGVYSDPKRDPRQHTISIVYEGYGEGELKSGSDARYAQIFGTKLPNEIAFDHKKILKDYFNSGSWL